MIEILEVLLGWAKVDGRRKRISGRIKCERKEALLACLLARRCTVSKQQGARMMHSLVDTYIHSFRRFMFGPTWMNFFLFFFAPTAYIYFIPANAQNI